FFFSSRRRHTRFSRDWSSDVCSSDLAASSSARIGCVVADAELVEVLQRCQSPYPVPAPCAELACRALDDAAWSDTLGHIAMTVEIGRASCRDGCSSRRTPVKEAQNSQ